MKKLLFILSVVLVSGITYGANNYSQANPFAYDLSSELRNNGNTLALTYTLNADAVTSNTYNTTHGVKINLIDEQQNSYNIRHITDPNSTCVKKGRRTVEIQISEIPAAFKDKPIIWEIEVFGNTKRTIPKQITQATDRPLLCHGVAVSKNPQTNYAGKIFVAEASNGDATNRAWLVGKGPSLLEYNITDLSYVNFHKKIMQNGTSSGVSNFSTALPEPHRVKISEDGRIFVTSYHNNSTTAVWEYKGDNNYNQIIYRNNTLSGDPSKNDRVIGMDVKGSGDNLTILLCYLNTSNAKLRCYEYVVGNKVQNAYNSGTLKCTYQLNSTMLNNIINYDSGKGSFFIKKGLVSVAYGAKDAESIWIGLDYFWSVPTYTSMLLHFDANGTKLMEYTTPSATARYGGGGIAVYIDDKTKNEVVVMGTAQPSNGTYTGEFRGYEISADGKSITNATKFRVDAPTTAMINDFSIDYANNLYLVSSLEANGLNNNGTGRLMQYALPYDGKRVTRSKSSITVTDPVPNILATDLCCTPHETKPKYIFSFNVNTKPEGVEIRFYNTEAEMLADCNQNEAYSRYDDHSKCQYYYRFTEGELKQGRMSVELDILGHKGDKILTDKLPSGKLYWNVFIKTRKSLTFAPIYVQPNTGDDLHYRLHATIDNNPDNDGFGHIYAIDYQKTYGTDDDKKNMCDNPCKLMIYSIGEAGIAEETMDNISSSTRYTLIQSTKTDSMVQPRRPAVAPDGMVYLPDYGDYEDKTEVLQANSSNRKDHKKIEGPHSFERGGIWLFDPVLNKGKTEVTDMPRFYKDDETTSGVCFYGEGENLKLYKTNTYEEITFHPNDYRTNLAYQTNGYRIYKIGNPDGTIKHQIGDSPNPDGTITHAIAPLGDSNGSMSIAATKQGVWLCQHRSGTYSNGKNDGEDAVALMFYDNNGTRRFESYTAYVDGQKLSTSNTAIMQSTPGGGMTVSKDEKRLYVVNHEGNILEFEIGSNSNAMTLSLINKFVNTTTYKTISTMNFDYAGNLVVTTDESYPANASQKTQIVVFTMPYNRDNARTIPASKSERLVPERLSQDFDNTTTLNTDGTYALDLYRPLQGATYNTICLPFDLDLNTLTTPHKLYGATVMDFTSVSTPSVGNETVLSLNFTKVDKMLAGKPYIIYVENHVRGLIEFSQVTRNRTVGPQSVVWNVQSSRVTYTGVYNPTEIEEGKTILVDQNRLANVTNEGTLSGFRGYFTIPESLRSLKAMISTRNDTPTGLEDMNITERTYQKFLREGRVYIRVGEALYTITGEKVE